jgi:hypothetical protein
MKVVLFYKESQSINRPDEAWFYRGVTTIPKTYIKRIYANTADDPNYPVPLGYWEQTVKERRPTLRERYWYPNWFGGTPEFLIDPYYKRYDCTVPDQIAKKILRKLGWKDSSDSDEDDKWWLLVMHLINQTEYFNGRTWAAIRAIGKGLPEPSTAEMQEEQEKRIYEI